MNSVERHAIRVGRRVRHSRSWWMPDALWWGTLGTILIVLVIGVATWATK